MNELPKLVKPYYTIEQTYERLKLAGAYLNDLADMYLLAKNGMIKIEVLIEGDYVLVNKNEAVPFQNTYRWRKVNFDEIRKILLDDDCLDADQIGALLNKFKHFEIMFFKEFVNDVRTVSLDVTDDLSDCKDPNLGNCIRTYKQPLLATPLSIYGAFHGWSASNNFHFDNDVFEQNYFPRHASIFAVEYEGEIYFVCNWEEVSEYTQPFEKHLIGVTREGERLSCPLWLNRQAIPNLLLDNKNKVVSAENIKVFETKYLGIHHSTSIEHQNNISTIQSQRENHLSHLINDRGQLELMNMGRFRVWGLLTESEKQLFPKREDPEAAIIKSFFNKQTLISFKKGRKG